MSPSSLLSASLNKRTNGFTLSVCPRNKLSNTSCYRVPIDMLLLIIVSYFTLLKMMSIVALFIPVNNKTYSASCIVKGPSLPSLNFLAFARTFMRCFLSTSANYSSISLLSILPKAATSASSDPYLRIPLTMLIAHSTVMGLSPYFWFR